MKRDSTNCARKSSEDRLSWLANAKSKRRRRREMRPSGSRGLKLKLLLPRPGMKNSNAGSLKQLASNSYWNCRGSRKLRSKKSSGNKSWSTNDKKMNASNRRMRQQ
jgi:hypothetical protein